MHIHERLPLHWVARGLFLLSHGLLIVVYCSIHCVTQIDFDSVCPTCLEETDIELCDPLTRTSSLLWGEKICNNMDYVKDDDRNNLTEFSAFESAAESLKSLQKHVGSCLADICVSPRNFIFQLMPTDRTHGACLFSASHRWLLHRHCVIVFLKDSRKYANINL